ncbi:MAG: LacI family DNA-binding transcriptional regulator [Lentisphaeria bacterium]
MAITMKDIARHCGLSGGAVSQVLRDPENPRFSPKTRKLILETAAKLDYRQNPLSRALRTNRTNLLGLMLPWNEPEVMDCVERVASENGYKILIQFTAHPRAGLELEGLHSFLDWNVDGILWEPSFMTNDDFQPLLDTIRREGPPLVMLERRQSGVDFPLVSTDYRPALEKCVRHLHEQGFRKVVFVAMAMEDCSGIVDDKVRDIADLAQNCGMEFAHCKIDTERGNLKQQAMAAVGDPANENSCFLCYSWLISDFVDAADALHRKIPEDLGLVMMIDLLIGGRLRVSNLLRPKITAIRVNSSELAELAVNRLLALIQKKPIRQPGALLHNSAELVIQQSTSRKSCKDLASKS